MIKSVKSFIQHYNNMDYMEILEHVKVKDVEKQRRPSRGILQEHDQKPKKREQSIKKKTTTT